MFWQQLYISFQPNYSDGILKYVIAYKEDIFENQIFLLFLNKCAYLISNINLPRKFCVRNINKVMKLEMLVSLQAVIVKTRTIILPQNFHGHVID